MPQSLIITTGAGTLTLPPDVVAGSILRVETWGAGSGGSGTGATQGGGGAGGQYASSDYVVGPNDRTNGIAYSVGSGGAGQTGVGLVGGNTSFSTNSLNLVPNTINNGAVRGSPGTLPTGMAFNGTNGLAVDVIDFGTLPTIGAYVDLRFYGTTTGTQMGWFIATSSVVVSAATAYMYSIYLQGLSGNYATGSQEIAFDCWDTSHGYISTVGANFFSITSSLVQYTSTASTAALSAFSSLELIFFMTASIAYDFVIRIAAVQFEAGSSATFWKSSPGYTLGLGGPAPITTGGGIGTATGAIGTVATFAGGSGRAYNAAGAPGGGAAGKDGAGVAATTTTSGAGDNSSGGAGVAVSSGTANAGTANVEGGSGGGAVTGNGGTGGVGGAPGGGGGGSDGGSGTRTGGAGGRGQIRVTYPTMPSLQPRVSLMAPILSQ